MSSGWRLFLRFIYYNYETIIKQKVINIFYKEKFTELKYRYWKITELIQSGSIKLCIKDKIDIQPI